MVGVRAAQIVDELVTVGERARWIADEAQLAGLSRERVVVLENTPEAIEYLRDKIHDQDVVLIKGSRSMEMDQIVSSLEEIV